MCLFASDGLGLHLDIFLDPETHTDAHSGHTGSNFELQSKMLQLVSSGGKWQISNSLLTCEWGGPGCLISKDINILQTHTLDTHNNSWQHLASVLAKPLADNLLSGLINALARWMNREMCQFYEILLCLLVFLFPHMVPHICETKKAHDNTVYLTLYEAVKMINYSSTCSCHCFLSLIYCCLS